MSNENVVVGDPSTGIEVFMIEKSINNLAHWWISRSNGGEGEWDDPRRWTTDPNKASKYAHRGMAEFVMGNQMKDCIITGHIWMGEGGKG